MIELTANGARTVPEIEIVAAQLRLAAASLQRLADSSPDPARAVVLRRAAANISVEIERIR